jgi:predicted nucleotidyltransferase
MKNPHPRGSVPPRNRTLDPVVLDEIVRRIVEVAEPERIILFGSAARGEMGPDSDVDLLVIKGGEYNPRAIARAICRRLMGVVLPVDIVVARPETLEHYRDVPFLLYAPALREGRTLYAA